MKEDVGVSRSKALEMKVNVLLAMTTAASIWLAGLRKKSILIPRSLAELTSERK